jgi:hypothetical protein
LVDRPEGRERVSVDNCWDNATGVTEMMSNRISWTRYLVLLGGVALVLGLTAGEALASPRSSQYEVPGVKEPAKVVKVKAVKAATTSKAASQPAASQPTTKAETLPFTGVDLVLIVGLGAVLVGGGLALRAAGRKRGEAS